MKRFIPKLLFLFLIVLTFACSEEPFLIDLSKVEKDLRFQRFDEAFFTSNKEQFISMALPKLKSDYPVFFNNPGTDQFWKAQREDQLQNTLWSVVSSQLSLGGDFKNNLSYLDQRYQAYFPASKRVQYYSYISNLDFEYPIIFADSLCFIASDLYLGANANFYQKLPEYLADDRDQKYLMRDIAEALITGQITAPSDNKLIDDMIYYGKIMFGVESLLPEEHKANLFKYTDEDFQFCLDNEKSIWSYFIENKILFSADGESKRRFIEIAPFSKFQMKFDNNTPGMIGRWIGWRIVRKYALDNNLSLQEVLDEENSRKILQKAAYKP